MKMSGSYKCYPIWNFYKKFEGDDERRVLCRVCGSSLSLGSIQQKRQLISHLKSQHEEVYEVYASQSKAQCKMCGNALSLRGDLPRVQSIGGLRRHRKACHTEQHELLSDTEPEFEVSTKRMKQEPQQYPVISHWPTFSEYEEQRGYDVANESLESPASPRASPSENGLKKYDEQRDYYVGNDSLETPALPSENGLQDEHFAGALLTFVIVIVISVLLPLTFC